MNNVNKILIIILVIVMVISLASVSFYLYIRYGNAKDNKANVSQNTTGPSVKNQNNPSLTKEATPFISYEALPAAKLGMAYKTTVKAGVKNVIAPVSAKVESGLPPGLRLTSCKTEYINPSSPLDQDKSSTGTCVVEGVPVESGNFKVRINFSVSGWAEDFFTDYPLVVNP